MFKHLNMAGVSSKVLASLPPASAGAGLPLHRQVEEKLRDLAASARFRDGELLPDELTLANQLGVSRGTVRAALARLVHDGLLQRKAGVGTRVARKAMESGIGAWRSLSREMADKGIKVQTFHSEFSRLAAPKAVAQALHVHAGTRTLRLDRIRGWGELPVLQSRSWFHPRLHLKGDEDFSGPLYEVIEGATGVVAENAHEEFSASVATDILARRLRVNVGEPLLLRSHTVFDRGGRPIEFAQVHYVSSRFALTLELRREEERKK
jgi:GntR family transcriptional regulator